MLLLFLTTPLLIEQLFQVFQFQIENLSICLHCIFFNIYILSDSTDISLLMIILFFVEFNHTVSLIIIILITIIIILIPHIGVFHVNSARK